MKIWDDRYNERTYLFGDIGESSPDRDKDDDYKLYVRPLKDCVVAYSCYDNTGTLSKNEVILLIDVLQEWLTEQDER